MGKILLISQNGNDTWFVNGISIGIRPARNIVGDKIRVALKELKVTEEDFINRFENNYKENIKRVLKNEEIPKEKLFNKIVDVLGKEKAFFFDNQLQNVLVNDNRMVVGEYETNARAREVKEKIDEIIEENFKSDKPIIIKMPKE